REVSGEDARAEADRRGPSRAAVDGSQLLNNLDRALGRHRETAELDWQQQPVDTTGSQRRDDLRVEGAGGIGRPGPVGDQGEHVAGELDVDSERGGHRLAFLLVRFTWARNMSTADSRWSTKRRPPGSFAHCCAVRPIWIAVHRSTSARSVTPASARAAA